MRNKALLAALIIASLVIFFGGVTALFLTRNVSSKNVSARGSSLASALAQPQASTGSAHSAGGTGNGPLIVWSPSMSFNASGPIHGTNAYYVATILDRSIPDKDQFETKAAYEEKVQALVQNGNFGEVNLTTPYLFSDLASWTYDAEAKAISISLPYQTRLAERENTYAGSNAFGAKVEVNRIEDQIVDWRLSYSGTPPDCLVDGVAAMGPTWNFGGTTDAEKSNVISNSAARLQNAEIHSPIAVPLEPDLARKLPQRLEVLTILNFDTREYAKGHNSLCLEINEDNRVPPTFDKPVDVITRGYVLNARILRLIVRNPDTGKVLFEKEFKNLGSHSEPSPAGTASSSDAKLPKIVGECLETTVASVETRLSEIPGSGSVIRFSGGGGQVSYDQIDGIDKSQPGDKIKVCLVSVPKDCPPGDDRGKVFHVINHRTSDAWDAPDAEHSCGGA